MKNHQPESLCETDYVLESCVGDYDFCAFGRFWSHTQTAEKAQTAPFEEVKTQVRQKNEQAQTSGAMHGGWWNVKLPCRI